MTDDQAAISGAAPDKRKKPRQEHVAILLESEFEAK